MQESKGHRKKKGWVEEGAAVSSFFLHLPELRQAPRGKGSCSGAVRALSYLTRADLRSKDKHLCSPR